MFYHISVMLNHLLFSSTFSFTFCSLILRAASSFSIRRFISSSFFSRLSSNVGFTASLVMKDSTPTTMLPACLFTWNTWKLYDLESVNTISLYHTNNMGPLAHSLFSIRIQTEYSLTPLQHKTLNKSSQLRTVYIRIKKRQWSRITRS